MTRTRREAANAQEETSLDSCASQQTDSAKFWYRTENDEATIVFCETTSKHLLVPERLGDVPVTAIAGNAFSDLTGIESATMPASLRAIGTQAFARCLNLRSIDLGRSLESIGEGAFRGCSRLASLSFPETLSRIGSSALSNTAVARIGIPAACTDIDADALCTGPSFPGSIGLAYASSLAEIAVSPDNPAYCMSGGVLCRRLPSGNLEAVLCAAHADVVELSPRVERVLASTFAGTCTIGHLRISESTAFPDERPPLPNGSCDRLTVDFAVPRENATSFTLEMPKGQARGRVLGHAFSQGRVRPETLARAYDDALSELESGYEKTRLMAARLAEPVLLDSVAAKDFRNELERELVNLCVHAGSRNDWGTLDNLIEAGALDAERIPDAIEALNRFGFTLAAAHVMSKKEKLFGTSCIDYGI